MSTKRRMAEQIMRMLTGGDSSAGSKWDIREIEVALSQAIAQRLKISHFQETMVAGETIPDGVKLAQYDNVKCVDYKNVSKIALPAIPVSLPRNMGIYHVGPSNDPFCGYIPVQTGQWGQVRTLVGMSDMLGQVTYEPREAEIILNKKITAGTDHLILLAIMDISKYDEWTPLPIPQDMEFPIIQEVVELLSRRAEANKIVESVTTK